MNFGRENPHPGATPLPRRINITVRKSPRVAAPPPLPVVERPSPPVAILGPVPVRAPVEPERPHADRPLETEERKADRVQRILAVRVEGRIGCFDAVITDVSETGVCLTVVDAGFTAAGSGAGLEGVAVPELRVAAHFGEGLVLTFPHEHYRLEAEVVRTFATERDGIAHDSIGCRWLRDLTWEERTFLHLPLALPPAPAGLGAVEAAPPPGVVVPAGAAQVVVIPASAPPVGVPEQALPTAVAVDGKLLGMRDLLMRAVERRATDLHLKAGSPPRMRVDGDLVTLGNRPLEPAEARGLVRSLLTPEQMARFDEKGDLDIAYSLEGHARFRINVLRARGILGMAIRRIPEQVPDVVQLGLAPACVALAERPRGLVLVTGPTGSGKSTTLAAMIQHINRTRRCHILTMEDPIEFIHKEDQAHITQREIGRDTEDFASALKRALRQDPNVILVGEMRDLETISLAVTAAETGHLVFATLHTTSAVLTVDRIVDVFPPTQQRQVRMQLADCLQGIVCQLLLPRIGGGVVCAQEVLMASTGVRSLIREGKAPQIGNMMQTGARDGMQTLEDALNDLIARGLITYDVALSKANHTRLIEKNGKPQGRGPQER